MPFVRATANQFLLVGHDGRLENRGSAVQSFLWPGTVWALVPADKQEAAFEFTQETRDGIPLRFKGIVIYRIGDPVVAAARFDFTRPSMGIAQINALLAHVVLGELRHAVSQMTMADCIEQRKTTLTGVVSDVLRSTVGGHEDEAGWGIAIEVAQLAQVFIVDAQLRGQLEAEVRNEVRLRSEQSDIRTKEAAELATLGSSERVAAQQVRTDEAARLATLASYERVAAQKVQADQEELRRGQELFAAQMAAAEQRANTQAPVRLLELAREAEVLREELEVRELRNRLRASEVEHDMLGRRAEQALRVELLPLEQAPRMVEAAASVLHGTNLTLYGPGAELTGQLASLVDVLAGTVRRAVEAQPHPLAE